MSMYRNPPKMCPHHEKELDDGYCSSCRGKPKCKSHPSIVIAFDKHCNPECSECTKISNILPNVCPNDRSELNEEGHCFICGEKPTCKKHPTVIYVFDKYRDSTCSDCILNKPSKIEYLEEKVVNLENQLSECLKKIAILEKNV